jgi:DNA-binding beta-propeller fold protein YncE/protein-tyrosine-phosphatase
MATTARKKPNTLICTRPGHDPSPRLREQVLARGAAQGFVIPFGLVDEMHKLLCLILVLASMLEAPPATAADGPALTVEEKIPLGAVSGRIDHLAYDSARQRLYVAELGNDSVGIVDLKLHRLVRTVSGFKEPQGIAYESSTDTVYVASGGDGSLRIFHGANFAPIARIDLGSDADNVRVDPVARRVYVGYGDGAIAVIDAVARKHLADIPLKGHPESFELESDGPRIFANVPNAGLIQILARDTGTSIGSWSTIGLQANYPLALDSANHRVLAVFRHPARMEAFDSSDGKRLGGVDVCGDADDVFVDAKRERVYVVCGDGSVDSYASGKGFVRVDRLPTSRGSRTGLYLPDIDRLAVAIRAAGNESAAVWLLRPTSTTTASAMDSPSDAGSIVMVCEHGNVKSLMAASYFNELAKKRHLPFHAIARGTAPNSTTVPPSIIEGLRSDGFDVANVHPAAITAAEVIDSRRVILINTELPAGMSDASRSIERWTDVPPASVNYEAARDSLTSHVERLIDQLENSHD